MKKSVQILSLIIALSVIFGLISAGCSYVYDLDEHPENNISDPQKEIVDPQKDIKSVEAQKKHYIFKRPRAS